MRKIITQATLGLLLGGAALSAVAGGPDVPASDITPGFYFGLGGGYNHTKLYTNSTVTLTPATLGNLQYQATEGYVESDNKMAPELQLGYWAPIDSEWLWGVQFTYKYLDMQTNQNNRTAGTILDAASTAPVLPATAGAQSMVFVSSRNRVSNEFLFLGYFGTQFAKGYAYLGAGAALFTVSNTIFSTLNTGGVGAGLAPAANQAVHMSRFRAQNTVWGAAFQLGYNYYFKPTWFTSFNYTYAFTGSNSFSNNSSICQVYGACGATGGPGAGSPSNNTVTLRRNVAVVVQELMFSVNKVFSL